MVEAIKKWEYERSKADLCLYYLTVDEQLLLAVPWVDNLILLGPQHIVDLMKSDLGEAFVCKGEGPLKEFVGSKISLSRDVNGLGASKFTQPVLVKKLRNKYKIDAGEMPPKIPANAGLVLVKGYDS